MALQGEGQERPGEGAERPGEGAPSARAVPEEVIRQKALSFEEASRCLNTLGKDESGCRYAYLKITATDLKLTEVAVVLKFRHVLFLDLSGNYLTRDTLDVLTAMPFLVLLKAERNRVESAGLQPMPYLQVLNLSQNQIKGTADVNQPLLECLELNHNDIYMTHFEVENVRALKQLELRSNLLFEISGQYPVNLERLYLPANKIANIRTADLAQMTNLQMLHLRDNSLQRLDGFSGALENLKYLNLRSNRIVSLKEFTKLQYLPKLDTLIVTGNPVCGEQPPVQEGEGVEAGEGGGMPQDPIRIKILVLLPNLKRVNKLPVTLEDRYQAEDIEGAVLNGLMEDWRIGEESEMPTTTDLTSESEYKTETESEV